MGIIELTDDQIDAEIQLCEDRMRAMENDRNAVMPIALYRAIDHRRAALVNERDRRQRLCRRA